MARGWESKAVEDQMAQLESDKRDRAKPALTPAEMERQAQRDGLLLSRTRTLTALQTACDPRYRALLERTLAHVDEELARLASAS
jgi:transposase